MSPSEDWQSKENPYRRRVVQGSFRHEKEILIGPRGAPAGVSLPRQGLSKNRSNQSGGLTPGPQGYFVLTPMDVSTSKGGNTVWVNRGWVPKTMIQQSSSHAP